MLSLTFFFFLQKMDLMLCASPKTKSHSVLSLVFKLLKISPSYLEKVIENMVTKIMLAVDLLVLVPQPNREQE